MLKQAEDKLKQLTYGPAPGDLTGGAFSSSGDSSDENINQDAAYRRDRALPKGVKLPTGKEPDDVDVAQFYISTEDLVPCTSSMADAAALAQQLESDVWTDACAALMIARRLAAHHPAELSNVLGECLPQIKNQINNLRSSVCKTALIAAQDLFKAYGEAMLTHLKSFSPTSPTLLVTLLHKAALGKGFVIGEAKCALSTMGQFISSEAVLGLLLT
eukprot:CAMPEP_0197617648 /NCGR_PEP_ID=MMETSP1326-20131121/61140_1 /TAXON_ID=1155430 /ORGANISM="Genus nov. species nov., Strain RCC2288" /LENGTH=215 /DNA_ID=CAMNT_0043186543 /DNA_START=404 /DNA_END=1048 /DNA_ORIENTATION=+